MKTLLLTFSILLIQLTGNTQVKPIKRDLIQNYQRIRHITFDPHSRANLTQIKTEHLHLDLNVDFENNVISGVAQHKMSAHNTNYAFFDVKDLNIEKITLGKEDNEETTFEIDMKDSILGSRLSVKITPTTEYINIHYSTRKNADALDWLPPSLTSGKKHPFLYTQGQAILTRTWIPCQDSPSNRISYSAKVTVPKDLLPVMSASNPIKRNKEGVYHFEMNQKIPTYLIALAVGNFTYTPLGDKCGTYSEPELSDACKYEFEDLPKMIETAQNLYGSYQWEKFDMVILPYSFPFGGMENPRLTFVNPTILAGDQSLISVIAHELAHSWSGNLVTNASWNDFWLNEGFTVYFENRIMEAIYGKEIADVLAIIEFQDLTASLSAIADSEHPEDSHLKLKLKGRDPDCGMTDIAYVKGAYFLRTIEAAVGREKFDAFLNDYFTKFAFQTITTEKFVKYLRLKLLTPNAVDMDIDAWIYNQGLPNDCVVISSERLENMASLAKKVNSSQTTAVLGPTERKDFITQEWQTFIRNLSLNLSDDVIRKIDEQIKFSESNPIIQSDWFVYCAKAGYQGNRKEMEAYLVKIGRRWLIENVYLALMSSENKDDHLFAKKVFEKAKDNYHAVTRNTIEEILKGE